MFWQKHVMVCCIWLYVLVIQNLLYICIVCVVCSKYRVHLVCRVKEWEVDQNLLFLLEFETKLIILCFFKMVGVFLFVFFILEQPELLTVLLTCCVSRKIVCLIR